MNKKQWLTIASYSNLLTFVILTDIILGVGSSIGAPHEVSLVNSLLAFSAWFLTGINALICGFYGEYYK